MEYQCKLLRRVKTSNEHTVTATNTTHLPSPLFDEVEKRCGVDLQSSCVCCVGRKERKGIAHNTNVEIVWNRGICHEYLVVANRYRQIFTLMQIIKKRLSIHRSGRILRNLWTEYLKVLRFLNILPYTCLIFSGQMSETCSELNSVRLRALSSFMENILEADTPLPVVMDELVDELSVIITGLLDVAHRSALQLSESDHDMDPLDKRTLAEAMRKSLLVAELILREKKNRDQMVNVPEIVR